METSSPIVTSIKEFEVFCFTSIMQKYEVDKVFNHAPLPNLSIQKVNDEYWIGGDLIKQINEWEVWKGKAIKHHCKNTFFGIPPDHLLLKAAIACAEDILNTIFLYNNLADFSKKRCLSRPRLWLPSFPYAMDKQFRRFVDMLIKSTGIKYIYTNTSYFRDDLTDTDYQIVEGIDNGIHPKKHACVIYTSLGVNK